MSGRQRRITLYATPRDTNAVLDIAKVADIVVFVLGGSPASPADDIDVDDFGTHCVAILKAQGIPAVLGMQVGLAGLAPKKAAALKKLGGRYFDTAFGADTKAISLDSPTDAQHFFRWVASDMKLKPLQWRDSRPYLLAEQLTFTPNTAPQAPAVPKIGQFSFDAPAPAAAVPTPATTGTLAIRGYLRGDNPLSANQLMHITGYGDFQIERIEGRVEAAVVYMSEKEKKQSRAASKAASKMQSRRHSVDEDMDMEGAAAAASASFAASSPSFQLSPHAGVSAHDVLLQRAVPGEQENLQGLVSLDPLANEQSLIDDDELADEGPDEMQEEEDDEMHDDDDDEEDEDEDAPAAPSRGAKSTKIRAGARDTSGSIIPHHSRKRPLNEAGAAAAAAAKVKAASKPGALVKSQVAWDDAVPDDEDGADDDDDDAALGFEDDSAMVGGSDAAELLEKRKLERDEQSHPDEIEFPMDTKCKERFARYRGLKSFKDSAWDSKENLPLEYGQIFQFQNFEASKNRVLKDAMLSESGEDGGLTDENSVLTQRFYPVTIFLSGVGVRTAESILATLAPVVAFGLFKYEHKVSVLHLSVKRANEYSAPIKAKEPMEFHVAFRRFVARPVYSHEGKGDKNPTQRFFQTGSFTVASVYGRIVFPPAPVIMFKPSAAVTSLMLGETKPGAAAASSSSAAGAAPLSLSDALIPAPLRTTALAFNAHVSPIVAAGTLLSVNPDRLLIKRIILTGTPISVHKRNAVVRHMFFNADDVRWFKPVELWTKYGLVGHIKESRGTKGYMKVKCNAHAQMLVGMAARESDAPSFMLVLFTHIHFVLVFVFPFRLNSTSSSSKTIPCA